MFTEATALSVNFTGYFTTFANSTFNQTIESVNATKNSETVVELISLTVVFALIFVIGVIGNSLVIAVILKVHFPKQEDLNNTQMYMLNLALADLLFLMICIPTQFVVHIIDSWVVGSFLCYFTIFCETVTMFASAYTLVALSFDRYFAIVHALSSSLFRTRKVGNIGLCLIWVLAIGFAIPASLSKTYYSEETVSKALNVENAKPLCMEAPGEWNKWLKVANMLFGYAVPLVFIMSCYAAVLWKLYSNANNSSIRDCSSQDAMLQKVTKIVIALVLVFAFDWFLYHTVKLWRLFGKFPYNKMTYLLEIFSHFLSYTNCCCNPVIYAFVSRSFRQDFKKAVFCTYISKARKRVSKKFVVQLRHECKDEVKCLHITEDKTHFTNPDKTSPFVLKNNKFFSPQKSVKEEDL